MTLFRDRYRIESARLPGWDYASAGVYFVTICTRDRACWLGDVIDGEVRLSEIGKIVAEEWLQTEKIRDNITLDEWVIMPNHFHGIIHINNMPFVETHCNASLPGASLPNIRYANVFGPQRNNLSSIIRGFKGITTKRIQLAGHDFAWQPRFHDQIIRDETTLTAVRAYIRNNPPQWALDRENPTNT